LKKLSFSLNERKTKVIRQHQRQVVTGIVVNRKLSVKRDELRNFRQVIYYIQKYGIESHADKIGIDKSNYVEHLLGKVNFFLSVKKNNPELLAYKKILITAFKQELNNTPIE
jgi:RNA-directed DNA polymerase